jgi:Fuc2NAc and GlcNAc transferase
LQPAWAIWWIGGVPALDLGLYAWHWGLVGQSICILGLVWLINLSNFMDGIDGIAGAEVICATTGAALMLAAVHARDLAWS